MLQRFGLKQIDDLPAKTIFFDANVLIYLFGIQDYNKDKNKSFSDKYASIFHALKKQQKKMVISVEVISEYINRLQRTEYNNYLNENKLTQKDCDFKKHFRSSDKGKQVVSNSYLGAKTILKHFELIGKQFKNEDIESLLIVDSLDFTDKIIYSICKENNYILMTNDTDFASSDIDILSAHYQLLHSPQ